ncbi:geminin-like [Stylophora pistillata]|uniref:geminin-like n=1 Tax=Stylophora pistillata TaxID=50429 RepID=UPI000C04E302|nr:geminin-like [Stylophora pistillata]
MEDNESCQISFALPIEKLPFDSDTPKSRHICDKNSPLNPGEVCKMRNHPKVTSVLFSPPRASRVGEGKIKPKSFSTRLYSSPTRKTKPSGVEKEKRKTLQVLQPAASGNGTLVGSRGVVRHNEMKLKKGKSPSSKLKQQKIKIPHKSGNSSSSTCADSSDSDTAVSSARKNTKSSHGESLDEAVALMVSDPPPERYWELLAEERRLALQEALEENERMHKELEELRERNKSLEEIAGQAEYFASLYQMVMEGEVPDTESSDNDEEVD